MQLSSEIAARIHHLKAPSPTAVADVGEIEQTVKSVLAGVRERGDEALREYSRTFDRAEVAHFEVSMAEREATVAALDPQTAADTRSRSNPCRACISDIVSFLSPALVPMCLEDAIRCCRRPS
jgi:sulfopropanediol 3-dehydrogenase